MTPDFITFTGFDAKTDINHMVAISDRYPVEWAILFSKNRQGVDNRYPDRKYIEPLFAARTNGDLKLAAHLCGKYAQDIMEGNFDHSSLPLGNFDRIQVNHVAPVPDRMRILTADGQSVIGQWRDPTSFPQDDLGIKWLYDPSGGRGLAPTAWPNNPSGISVGYAGGINPDNAMTINNIVGERSPVGYWLDMESGVRTNDWFDLALVERVCVAIYG